VTINSGDAGSHHSADDGLGAIETKSGRVGRMIHRGASTAMTRPRGHAPQSDKQTAPANNRGCVADASHAS
jgi:hypothetical protein